MNNCENVVPETGKSCGDYVDGPFHQRFCSDECADRVNANELLELGITESMLRDALEGYYECKELIEGGPPLQKSQGLPTPLRVTQPDQPLFEQRPRVGVDDRPTNP